MAALRLPSTSSVFIAALSSRSASCALCACAAAMADAATATANVQLSNGFIDQPPHTRLPAAYVDHSSTSSSFRHDFEVEPVPDPTDAFQESRRLGRRLDLAAQIRDLVVDDALCNRRV